MKECCICNTDMSSYRCPKCSLNYCSIDCCKSHKTTCSRPTSGPKTDNNLGPSVESGLDPKTDNNLGPSVESVDKQVVDTQNLDVDDNILEKVKFDKELMKQLSSKKLQRQLLDIDSSADQIHALKKLRRNCPDIEVFFCTLLKVIDRGVTPA